MVLNSFFVFSDLLLHLVQHQVEGGSHVVSIVMGDEVVLVLCIHENFDPATVLVKCHCHCDRRDSLEKIGQFLRLTAEVLLNVGGNRPMLARNCNLHNCPS